MSVLNLNPHEEYLQQQCWRLSPWWSILLQPSSACPVCLHVSPSGTWSYRQIWSLLCGRGHVQEQMYIDYQQPMWYCESLICMHIPYSADHIGRIAWPSSLCSPRRCSSLSPMDLRPTYSGPILCNLLFAANLILWCEVHISREYIPYGLPEGVPEQSLSKSNSLIIRPFHMMCVIKSQISSKEVLQVTH